MTPGKPTADVIACPMTAAMLSSGVAPMAGRLMFEENIQLRREIRRLKQEIRQLKDKPGATTTEQDQTQDGIKEKIDRSESGRKSPEH